MLGALLSRWRTPLLAVLLACVLSAAWAARDASDLSRLRLPDTDDMVRLQQVRDWLSGQAFGDLAQHRLGPPPGLEMHWSRLGDLVPAALVLLLSPAMGASMASVAAVMLWPAALFAAALLLVGTIARALDAPETVAIIVAALAYPATSLFLPGRIDHHALQIVLVLLLLRAAVGPGTPWTGVIAAMAMVASLDIGLETAPLIAIGGGALVLLWVAEAPGARERLFAFGLTLPLALAGAAALLRTSGWSVAVCDGFTRLTWQATQAASLPILGLALFAVAGPGTRRARIVATGTAGAVASASVLLFAPQCLNPYGQLDPVLARLWLAQVGEAQPLFGTSPANAIAYSGLALAGLAATLVVAIRRRQPGWWIVATLLATALAVTCVQLRGAYAAALLAAPGLAVTIAGARTRGPFVLAAAWIVSTGILYPLAGTLLFPPKPQAGANCTTPDALARLAALPRGRLLAPFDLGAYALAATPHAVLAAPYHRNNRGNRAMTDFFLGQPGQSEAIARAWGVDYVAFCTGDLDGFARVAPQGFAADLRAGRIPAWLVPVGEGDVPRIYRLTARH